MAIDVRGEINPPSSIVGKRTITDIHRVTAVIVNTLDIVVEGTSIDSGLAVVLQAEPIRTIILEGAICEGPISVIIRINAVSIIIAEGAVREGGMPIVVAVKSKGVASGECAVADGEANAFHQDHPLVAIAEIAIVDRKSVV